MINLLGFAASLAVLASFLMQTMLPLRLVAIGSNVLFIAYGYCAHLPPVLCLHIALLPINIARLSTLYRGIQARMFNHDSAESARACSSRRQHNVSSATNFASAVSRRRHAK
jgi:hypothetical protein